MRRLLALLTAVLLLAQPAYAGPIDSYPVVTPTGPEKVIGSQGGVTVNMTAASIAALATGNGAAGQVATNAALIATANAAYPNGVWRTGVTVTGDAPPWFFKAQTGTCASHSSTNDVGSCVDASDGNSFAAVIVGAADVREWGASYPFTLHVNAVGTDAGWCFGTGALACNTLQYAANQALKLDFSNQSNTISLDGGTSFAGAIVSGAPVRNGAGGISGQYLTITGNGTATVTAAAGQVFNLEASSGAQVIIKNLTCSVASGNTCAFAQNSGSVMQVGPGLICQMAAGSSGCLYAEANSLLELSTGETLTIQGSTSCAIEAASGAVVEFDPGVGTVSTGTGLTLSGGGGFLCPQGGFVEWAWSTVSGAGATGDLVKATLGGKLAYFNSPPDPPGNGYVRMNAGTVIETGAGGVVYPPTIGSCSSNCSLQAGATNYDMNIVFTGVTATAAVVFGAPVGTSKYFSARPSCEAGFVGASPATVLLSGFNAAGFTVGITGGFANNELVSVHCAPPSGG